VGAVLNRRLGVVLVALALLAAGCARSQDDSPVIGGSATTLTPDEASTTTTANANGSTGTTRRGSSNGSGGVTATTSKMPESVRETADGAPGEFAGVLLAPSPASSIVLDVLVQSGEQASPDVLSTLRDILAASSGKPVTVRGPTEINAAGNTFDGDAVRHIADSQGKAQGDSTAVIHLLYLRGSFSDDGVLGVTVRADTMAVFPDQISQASSPLASPRRLEQAVTTHELGHVLGLVDLWLNDYRADQDHPGHSTNPHSVMYWAVESDLVGQVLDGPPPVAFDGADQNDLQRIHAGAAPASQ
jgi:hypothetical protein